MKLSLVFELLLIFILLAFAASKSVKHHKHHIKKVDVRNTDNDGDKISDNNINKYCKCVESHCNCCRDFKLPVVELNGPGCASLMYLNGNKMSVSLSFGKKVITNRTLSSRKPSPVCMPLPGGLSKFCGRVYNIARAGEEFRACLGLELQSKKTVEAAVRVSCFKFGPRGVTSEAADPLPLVPQDEKREEEDDDDDEDDYDAFGLGGGDEDDDDEEEDDDEEDDDGSIDAVNDIGAEDYSGFSLLGEDLLGDLFGSTGSKKPKKKHNVKKQAPTTTTTTTTTKRPRPSRRPTRKPSTKTTTPRTVRSTTVKTRRSTRKPQHNRRSTRKPTTVISTLSTATSIKPSETALPATVQVTESTQLMNTISGDSVVLTPVNDETPSMSVLAATTPNSVTNFDDSGLEMSLAHITGQLSAMPVTPMVAEESKQSIQLKKPAQPIYEKVQTITLKPQSTVSLTSSSVESFGDNMVQIVQSLDSFETTPENEAFLLEETRGHDYHTYSFLQDDYDGLTAPKKNKNQEFHLDDLDVLDLTKIGETVGDQLGIFGKNKKNKNKHPTKGHGNKDHNDDYDDLIDAMGHTLMMKKSDKGETTMKRDRRRQNKMMRGEWTSRSVVS